jgi:2-phosphosulfolactate phosphatase
MNVNVILSPLMAEEIFFKGKTTVVIDVLRATTTITTALENGAKEVIPLGSIENAINISKQIGGQSLLCGERNTKKIEGFAHGNSPLEFMYDGLKGKSVLLFTTNGTRAIYKSRYSELLYTASFNNIAAVCDKLIKSGNNLEIFCSGNNSSFSMEDTVCAGALISELNLKGNSIKLTDSAKGSLILFERYKEDIEAMLRDTDHGKILIENGFDEDIKYAARINISSAVPYFTNNVIKLS